MNKLNMEYCGTTKEEVPDVIVFEWAQENPLGKTSHRMLPGWWEFAK